MQYSFAIESTSIRRFLLLCVMLTPLALATALRGQSITDLIPAGRMIHWSRDTVGVPGGIPYRTNVFCNVQISIPGSALVALGDGVTDDSPAINAAFANCPYGEVVYIPTGTYLCSNALSLTRNGVTVRGDGTNTVLLSAASLNQGNKQQAFINCGGYLIGPKRDVVLSGTTRGSSQITVGSTANLVPFATTIVISQNQDYD